MRSLEKRFCGVGMCATHVEKSTSPMATSSAGTFMRLSDVPAATATEREEVGV
jgi:hypothetical protein